MSNSKRPIQTIIEDLKSDGETKRRMVTIIDSEDEEDYLQKRSFADEIVTNGRSHVTLPMALRDAEIDVIGEFNSTISYNKRLVKETVFENAG